MTSRSQCQTKFDAYDALALVLDGNESDMSDLSSEGEGTDELDLYTPSALNEQQDEHVVSDKDSIEDEDCREGKAETPQEVEASPAQSSLDGHILTPVPKRCYRWRARDVPVTNPAFVSPLDDIPEQMNPIDYFAFFWTDELVQLIEEQTNLYSTQQSGTPIKTTSKEIEKYIGINMMMSVVQLPAYRLYWSSRLRYAPIADAMPRTRYEKIRKYLHFSDNHSFNANKQDKLYKIKPVLESVRGQCLKIPPEQIHSVDEQIIPAKTKYSGIRQYNPKKPHKWGFKNLVRAGASGIMYDFYIYVGKESTASHNTCAYSNLSKSAQVVAKLCEALPPNSGHQVFFDNWFTTMELLIYLKKLGIHACGTVRSNRLQGCTLKSNKEMIRLGRGSLDFKSDMNSGILVAKWYDNNAVHIASNFVGVNPVDTVLRWNSKEKQNVRVACPRLILTYNKGMGGVDLCDMLISLYPIPSKTRRWYIKIFWHCVNIAKVNAWNLYRRHCNKIGSPGKSQLSLLQFTTDVALSLISVNKDVKSMTQPGRPSRKRSFEEATSSNAGRKTKNPDPPHAVRFDQVGHWPIPEQKIQRGRCRLCKTGFSQIRCVKCNVHLCLRSEKNCFTMYHNS